MRSPPAMSRRRLQRCRSSALVVTLAIIVLVTMLVLAFFSFTTANLKIEASRADRKEADFVALSGEAYVTGLFLQEIVANSTLSAGSAGSVTNYYPVSATNIIPSRVLGSAISAIDANYFNLIRQSVAASEPNASLDNTSLAAANGRAITPTRWNQPCLIGGAGLTAGQLPNWIYLDSMHGATNAASVNTIGRFAYNVYDIGGLLDVNAAGYPGTLTPQQISALTGTAAGADLTQLPGITAADVTSLVTFRNSNVIAGGGDYIGAVQGAMRSGFMHSTFTNTSPDQSELGYTNNYFSNRQDLLLYAQTQNTDLTNALPYLTTFSRNLTAPSWVPINPANATNTPTYAALAMTSGSTNRAAAEVRVSAGTPIMHYNDDGSFASYTIAAGNPLLQRRFSLAKLAWITSQGPAANISSAAITACFGLTWNSSTLTWSYQDSTIKTLDQIQGREPNFFEMLKAAILTGSVGCPSPARSYASSSLATPALTTKQALEADGDLQILKIGADIIDCAKSDNFPTNISLGSYMVHGAQDLPYLYGIMPTTLLSTVSTSNIATPAVLNWGSIVFVPLLFDPYYASTTTVGSPAEIRVIISSGSLINTILENWNGTTWQTPVAPGPPNELCAFPANTNLVTTSIPPITFPYDPILKNPYRGQLAAITNADSATALNTQITQATAAHESGFVIYTYPT
ncbi:MAG TPA: hypothetical protein VGC39_02575, partial [Candidatus Methylacidiphilales bacterium]